MELFVLTPVLALSALSCWATRRAAVATAPEQTRRLWLLAFGIAAASGAVGVISSVGAMAGEAHAAGLALPSARERALFGQALVQMRALVGLAGATVALAVAMIGYVRTPTRVPKPLALVGGWLPALLVTAVTAGLARRPVVGRTLDPEQGRVVDAMARIDHNDTATGCRALDELLRGLSEGAGQTPAGALPVSSSLRIADLVATTELSRGAGACADARLSVAVDPAAPTEDRRQAEAVLRASPLLDLLPDARRRSVLDSLQKVAGDGPAPCALGCGPSAGIPGSVRTAGLVGAAPKILPPEVEGPLASAQVLDVLTRRRLQFAGCYLAAGGAAGNPHTVAHVTFVVGAPGTVASPVDVTGASERLGACLRSAYEKMTFPPTVGVASHVRSALEFSSSGTRGPGREVPAPSAPEQE